MNFSSARYRFAKRFTLTTDGSFDREFINISPASSPPGTTWQHDCRRSNCHEFSIAIRSGRGKKVEATCERMEIKGESGWVIKVDEKKVKKSAQLAQECAFREVSGPWFMSRWESTFSLKVATSISIFKLLLRHFAGQKGDARTQIGLLLRRF